MNTLDTTICELVETEEPIKELEKEQGVEENKDKFLYRNTWKRALQEGGSHQ